MAMPHDVPFAMQEGPTGATQNSQERLINMFAEITASGRSQIIRRQRAALQSIYAITGEKRCIEKFRNLHYCVIDATFYSFDGAVLTSLGTLNTSSGPCTMIFNDNAQVMISDGMTGYYWDSATSTFGVTSSAYSVGNLAYVGGFGIFNIPGTGEFAITAENDFRTVDPLDFATAASSPDLLVTIFVNHNELWLAGQKTTEVWQLSGGSFPFSAFTNAIMERGCGAALSYASEDNTAFFLGDDFVVYRVDGYRPAVVSTRAVEYLIAQVSSGGKANAYAVIYTSNGQKFYTLTFPGELTLQYNITTQLWNEAKTFGSNSWDMIGSAGHTADYVMTAAGICALTRSLNQDEGGTMWRGGISAPGYAGGALITIYEFYLDAEVGRAAIGKTANVMMRVALDGTTFRNIRTRSLGTIGAYETRAIWRKCGQGRKPVIEISTTDDFEFTIMGTGADTEVADG